MLKFEDLIVFSGATLREAMEKMTRNRKGVLFICDDSNRLLGVVSDGDIRRSLLSNTLMLAPVTQIMNTAPVVSQSQSEAEKMLAVRPVLAVPVVSASGVIECLLLQESGENLILKSNFKAGYTRRESLGALALIPARGGSKRIPKKNLQITGGKPLMAWAILAAKHSRHIAHTLVSTDNEEIQRTAKQFGAEAPWLRPDEYSTDQAKTIDVVLHSLEWAMKNYNPKPEYAVLLEPTAPFRRPNFIDEALNLLVESGADSVVSVCELNHVFHPEEALLIEGGELKPFLPGRSMDSRKLRGEQQSVFILSGHVYAFKISSVLKNKSLYGKKCVPYKVDWESYIDVDIPEDLRVADLKLRQAGLFESKD